MSSLISQYAEPVNNIDLGIGLTDQELEAAVSRATAIRQDIENDLDVTALESLCYQFFTAADVCGTMNNIQQVVNTAVESGSSLSTSAAKLLKIVSESELNRVVQLSQEILPDNKYFSNNSTRVAATTIAAESIAESVKNMIDRLVKMIRTIWNHIKAFLMKILDRRKEVSHKLEILRDKAKSLVDDLDLPRFLDEYSSAQESSDKSHPDKFHFGINNKCDGETTRAIIRNHLELIAVNREIIVNIVECLHHVIDIGEKEKLLTWEIDHLVNNIKDKFSRFTLTRKKLIDGETSYSYGYFYNDQICVLREHISRSAGDTHVKLFNLEFDLDRLQGLTYRAETLSRVDMVELAGKSIELLDKAAGLERVIPIVEKALHSATDHLSLKFDIIDTKEENTSLVAAMYVIRDLFKFITASFPKIVSGATTVSDNLAGYIKASIHAHHAKSLSKST